MRVYMHCKGCAKKVKKILRRFDGVEDVFADAISRKVVVKGKKAAANPMKVVEHVQKKTGHKVELISPIPPPPEEKKEEENKEEPKPPKPEEEPLVITVVLKMHIHCKACAQWIMKRILRMKGVQSAELDLKASHVTVKGVLEEAKLAQYVYKRTGKHVAIIKSGPVAPLESAGGDNMGNEEKKVEGGEDNNGEGEDRENRENDTASIAALNMYMYYPQFAFPEGYYSPPPPPGYFYQAAFPPPSYAVYAPYHHQMMAPQIFSDENPNACSVM
ncbi:hypothetical protein C2845_PM15G06250 [Panicum miliaceum]|uniref:HMA domain-containing protein n=1 Tax=Panicum miliaceum TaxID=4540 RepID=A0A3L6Q8Q1_PANMI|nr:hypothetical protein C2845_PM15G06250 [Panicum miliaceum]